MENLKYLKDVISLEKVILGLKQANSEELQRIAFLQKQKAKKEEEIAQLQKSISQSKETVVINEKAIFEIEKKLEQNKSNLNAVTSQQQEESLNSSIQKLEEEFNQLQDETLELLESIDENESNESNAHEFIKGLTETISEIEKEVQDLNTKNEAKIKEIEVQITGFLSEVPKEAAMLYELASKKRPHDAATYLVGQSCGSCKFTYAAAEVAIFNKGQDLIQCKGCSRLLLPAPLRNI